jgi:hypothetical protein
MTTARLALAAALAALFSLVTAGSAQAYPDPIVKISLATPEVVAGLGLDVEVSSGGMDCDWMVSFGDQTKTGSGTSFSDTFVAPKTDVALAVPVPLTATCLYAGVSAGRAATGPGTDDPGTDDPGTDDPGTDDPGTDDPATGTPTTDDPGTATAVDSTVVTVVPTGGTVATVATVEPSGVNSLLPGAGGSRLWILVVGGVLVLIGVGTVVATRRRS